MQRLSGGLRRRRARQAPQTTRCPTAHAMNTVESMTRGTHARRRHGRGMCDVPRSAGVQLRRGQLGGDARRAHPDRGESGTALHAQQRSGALHGSTPAEAPQCARPVPLPCTLRWSLCGALHRMRRCAVACTSNAARSNARTWRATWHAARGTLHNACRVARCRLHARWHVAC